MSYIRPHPKYIFKFYKDKKKEWRWSLRARNGRIIAVSSEGYKQRKNMVKAFYHLAYALQSTDYTIEGELK